MRIKKLHIKGYKNLKDISFDFDNNDNKLVVLIGLNASGKSNVLEAISKIIYGYYYKQNQNFEFELIYELDDGNKIKLQNGEVFVNNNKKVRAIEKYLPSQVIACYSGEETRLWEEVFSKPYLKYFNKIKLNYIAQKLQFIYVNKYSWEIALLTLLCHNENEDFVKNLFGVSDLNDIDIEFIFSENYEGNKLKFVINDTNVFTIPSFTDKIKEEQEETDGGLLKISQISTMSWGDIQNNEQNNKKWCNKLFEYLFLSTMPKRKKLIDSIKIKGKGKDVRALSEGEKKLILVKCISSILADEKSIVLYDEPDVSLHISKKIELKKLIEKDNHITILTTHSPTLVAELDSKNIFILNSTSDGAEVKNVDTIKNIESITDTKISLIEGTLFYSLDKHILLVEGINDYNYIKEAINKLNYSGFNFHIINCGGADNVPVVLEKSIISLLKPNQKCICLFDNDKQGKDNYEKVKKLSNKNVNNNIIPMHLPRPNNEGNEDFVMENYFPVSAYKNIIVESINRKDNYKELSEYQKPKSVIEKKYQGFSKGDYEGFRTLLKELVSKIN